MTKMNKTDEEWKSMLTDEQYQVTRNHGTERAFTGAYWDNKADGKYLCVCCGEELFSSETKYDSGSGWPSFWEPIDLEHVDTTTDKSFFMTRTEVHCAKCDANLTGCRICDQYYDVRWSIYLLIGGFYGQSPHGQKLIDRFGCRGGA